MGAAELRDFSMPGAARRAVRLTFSVDGVRGCQDFVLSAGSEQGALVLAGVALGQELMWLMLSLEYHPESFSVLTTQVGTAKTRRERIEEILARAYEPEAPHG